MIGDALPLEVETDLLSTAIRGRRAVFYEELAEYGLALTMPTSDLALDSNVFIKYHINNLILLSMYFDVVFIETATIFNAQDPFARRIIQGTLANRQFRMMMKLGVVQICGWGGRSSREMYSNALDFAATARGKPEGGEFSEGIKAVFVPPSVLCRDEGTPDISFSELLRGRLDSTALSRRSRDADALNRAIESSISRNGQFVLMTVEQSLSQTELDDVSRRAFDESLLLSWNDHLSVSVPGAYSYVPMLTPASVSHTFLLNGKELRSFLYSPRIFGLFLRKQFNVREYAHILSRPYEMLHVLRNGDWARFREAYHDALEVLSLSLSHVELSVDPVLDSRTPDVWAQEVWNVIMSGRGNLDVNTFLQSLAAVAGVLLGAPVLGPAFRALGSVIGDRINRVFLRRRAGGARTVSPYLRKIRLSLAN